MKINTALILKEENLVRERLDRFTHQYSDVERENQNANAYWTWQRQVREEAKQSELEKLETQRMMSKQSLEDAIVARNNLVLERQARARALAQQDRDLCRERSENERTELENRQQAVSSSRELRENPRLAKERVFHARKINATQVTNETRTNEHTALKKVPDDLIN